MRSIILAAFLFVTAANAASKACQTSLTNSPIPWVDAKVSNFELKQLGVTYGFAGILKGRPVVARVCNWCPHFGDIDRAMEWLTESELGRRTEAAVLALRALTKKNLADHFYGLALNENRIYFVSKMPDGRLLHAGLDNWSVEKFSVDSGVETQTPPVLFKPNHVSSLLKVRNALRPVNELDPLYRVEFDFSKIGSTGNISLLDLFESMEWTVRPNDEVRLSFFNLGKFFDQDGNLRQPLYLRKAINVESISTWQVLLSTIICLNTDPFTAYLNLLHSRTFYYADAFEFVRWGAKVRSSNDHFLQRLSPYWRAWGEIEPRYEIRQWEENEMTIFNETRISFASEKLLLEHFEKHGHEFNTHNANEYLESAVRFLRGENIGTELGAYTFNKRLSYIRKSGAIEEYVISDPAGNIFAVVSVDGRIRTYFRNNRKVSGMTEEQYFLEQLKKDILKRDYN